MSIEHSGAFRALPENRMFASSFVVLRAQFETILRAVWAFYSDTNSQISRISARLFTESECSAKNLPQVQSMLESLAAVANAKVPFEALSEFKGAAWGALYSYTHGGIHPLSEWQTDTRLI